VVIAVASAVVVVYDWGELAVEVIFAEGLIDIPHTFSSTDIRTRGTFDIRVITGAAISLRIV
jgi:hypothetical protein